MEDKKENFEVVYPKLSRIKLFSDFSDGSEENKRIMNLLYNNLAIKHFKTGETIIKEGEIGETFYILLEGEVQILHNTKAGDSIALANLTAEQNVYFGETALIGSDARTATVKATSNCKTAVLSNELYLDICNKEPLFGYRVTLKIAQRMSETIRKTNSDMTTLYEALLNEVEGI